MNFRTIKVEIDGSLGRLTLNRPERLNAMNAAMLRELVEAARWFDEQREARVVIVGGAGRAFCAGADLKESPTAEAVSDSGKSWLYRREAAQYGRRMADAIEHEAQESERREISAREIGASLRIVSSTVRSFRSRSSGGVALGAVTS